MPNPTLRTEIGPANLPPPKPPANGILAWIGGDVIAKASKTLPEPKEGLTQVVAVDVPDQGMVNITYRANSYKHGRNRHWHWLAVRADRADPV